MRISDALVCRPTMRHRGVVVAACATALVFAANVASSLFLEDDAGDTTTVEIETPASDDRCDGLDSVNDGRERSGVNDRRIGPGNVVGTTRVASMGIPSSSSSDAIFSYGEWYCSKSERWTPIVVDDVVVMVVPMRKMGGQEAIGAPPLST